jgi:hypothetical protein
MFPPATPAQGANPQPIYTPQTEFPLRHHNGLNSLTDPYEKRVLSLAIELARSWCLSSPGQHLLGVIAQEWNEGPVPLDQLPPRREPSEVVVSPLFADRVREWFARVRFFVIADILDCAFAETIVGAGMEDEVEIYVDQPVRVSHVMESMTGSALM